MAAPNKVQSVSRVATAANNAPKEEKQYCYQICSASKSALDLVLYNNWQNSRLLTNREVWPS